MTFVHPKMNYKDKRTKNNSCPKTKMSENSLEMEKSKARMEKTKNPNLKRKPKSFITLRKFIKIQS